MQILNIGSLNIDHVYQVDHIARPGETISSSQLRTVGGGKGANQTLALARAGACVKHAGCIGADGDWVCEILAAAGADISHIRHTAAPTGHAIIQVAADGENSIVLFGGANREQCLTELTAALDTLNPGDIVLIQNEINLNIEIINTAHARNLVVCCNPAPFEPGIREWPLTKVGIFVLNETEAGGLLGVHDWEDVYIKDLSRLFPQAEIIVTLGERGVIYQSATASHRIAAVPAKVVDTTAAGDTFIGYFFASRMRGLGVVEALTAAVNAAAITVSRPGAMDSIPTWAEVQAQLLR
jgi:ribokinase